MVELYGAAGPDSAEAFRDLLHNPQNFQSTDHLPCVCLRFDHKLNLSPRNGVDEKFPSGSRSFN